MTTESQKRANKKWREKNKEYFAKRTKEWISKNSERHKESMRKYFLTKKGKDKRYIAVRKNVLRNKFNLTEDMYKKMMTDQGGLCLICKKKPGKKKLSIDHCHKTNKVRGLLCNQCNVGLGYFKDNQDLLVSAITYLNKYTDVL